MLFLSIKIVEDKSNVCKKWKVEPPNVPQAVAPQLVPSKIVPFKFKDCKTGKEHPPNVITADIVLEPVEVSLKQEAKSVLFKFKSNKELKLQYMNV
ncbi:hypothetical protein FACS1894166_11540 [Bacilli bacterium]|nr:hypothetical protein FACS1894166_11540 [Bacilli bacterium]